MRSSTGTSARSPESKTGSARADPVPEHAKALPVLFIQGAERDLRAIYQRRLTQRGPEGPDGAEAVLDRLVDAIESLDISPQRGPVPPELDVLGIREYRQLSLPPWRVIYRAGERDMTVMIVADARRDFRTLLEERLIGSG
ncbi:MAG: hypothetical protein B7Z34_04470 [Novosphingobium sp. 12-62-10]|nr:MAG: hypothetical protein B7Z34_04470 [Novosphingobium sp. 12-62-10]